MGTPSHALAPMQLSGGCDACASASDLAMNDPLKSMIAANALATSNLA